MTEKIYCTSCKVEITNRKNSTIFPCPNCGKVDIIRCGDCRRRIVKYICPSCQFEGP